MLMLTAGGAAVLDCPHRCSATTVGLQQRPHQQTRDQGGNNDSKICFMSDRRGRDEVGEQFRS